MFVATQENGTSKRIILRHIEPSKEKRNQIVLPKPDGPLVHIMPSSAIDDANSAVSEFLPMAVLMKTVPLLAIR